MWIRKRFDITDRDIGWALGRCFLPGNADGALARIVDVWDSTRILVTLSVRSGFDLLLETLDWPAGDEIIMSGLTIPDMPRIVQEHGLVPVGVDLVPETMAPLPAAIEALITPRTRAVLIAHLFGGLCDLDGIAAVCRRHGLMLIEDCAQSWVGHHQEGDPRADVSFYSFGPIKTNTALAGGVLEIRQEKLHGEMLRRHSRWPRQSRLGFFSRLCRYWLLKRAASRPGLGLIAWLARCFGTSHDAFVAKAARGFPGPGFFRRIRRQPALPLLELLHRKLAGFDPGTVRARQNCGQALAASLARKLPVPGIAAIRQTWWVLSVLVDQPDALVDCLWRAGFDATRACSLKPVGEHRLPAAGQLLDHLVFLPFDLTMPAGELDRMIRLVLDAQVSAPVGLEPAHLSVRAGESVSGPVAPRGAKP